ncbi:cobalt-precorrin-5B (C(1))-methyltransferase CbiD [Leptolyngbya iicbica]|uniref:Cobalt-precorrin-5B C(1)-methyltransferase n=2 Tax=Cyanophyceae TaxID=3028117 RepID=A0A4Q7E164_9CYAN|nr:cobalt-precorrin-5B (C(1))-methyltransferase CbiD [Leptolyngbya sp. LK]RZM75688.1 cobalt-precorrin-5B (C(1))-methyltransferase [Leptolyngbya sp. LK]
MLPDTNLSPDPRAGYTLPVFACASAIAALQKLIAPDQTLDTVEVNLINPERTASIPVEQVAQLPDGSALAITRSDPGDNLDLTRHTPIWAVVSWGSARQPDRIRLEGGEGVGKLENQGDRPAIYAYAQQVMQANLEPLLPPDKSLQVTIILPEGRSLALRTSNAAFGVVDGLSLLGTSGISEPLSAPGQLEAFRQNVREQAQQFDTLVFCVGENGLQRALTLGIAAERRVKTGNWLGPLLIEAALCGVQGILLLGYHGKLIKLAGGIFHTHHYVADGRQEILSAIAAAQGLPTADVQQLLAAATVEAGLTHLRQLDQAQSQDWVQRIYQPLVERIDQRAIAYIQANADRSITVGAAVFDRQREIVAQSDRATTLLQALLVSC